jgi:VWFA-related protein
MKYSGPRLIPPAIFPLILLVTTAFGQQAKPQTPTEKQVDDVVRVNTALVQTDVTVVDKRGNFVEGLNSDQFELRVDARVQPITSFERVATGSAKEAQQLSAARDSNGKPQSSGDERHDLEPNRGRVIFFFVDDVHLAGDSMARARAGLLRFVNKQMAAGDRVAILSTSGQIGFLQQLTENKAVLREAIDRLHLKRGNESTSMKVPISEVDANLVANHRDTRLFSYLVDAVKNEFQTDAFNAALIVRSRIRQINGESRLVEVQTLYGLQALLRSTAQLPGRKLVFFVSDGFIVDDRKSNAADVLREVIKEAARVGAVVYTMNTRATFSDPAVDATRNDYLDFSSRQGGRLIAESKMPQEPLETLADETGGRSFLNPNGFDEALAQAIEETSKYYLLAWRPDSENQRNGKSRVEIVIKGRPDLRVRMRRHSFDVTAGPDAKPISIPNKLIAGNTPDDALLAALASLYPRRELSTSLSVGYLYTPETGTSLNVSMEIDDALGFDPANDKKETAVDVLGIALDDRGMFSSFKQRLNVTREAMLATNDHRVQWNQSMPLPAGLYQVRLAVRDRETGRVGSALQWIEVPEISANGASISSIFVGERRGGDPISAPKPPIKVNRVFDRSSRLRYLAYAYNATQAADPGGPAIEVKVLRDGEAVRGIPVTQPVLASVGNSKTISLSGEIDLARLAAGIYTLQISVIDKPGKTSASQQIDFVIR